ncbi:hypothetical protein MMC25_007568 [Agyrium rufum]|nr:hypothetical protein [Agyrium rufum]
MAPPKGRAALDEVKAESNARDKHATVGNGDPGTGKGGKKNFRTLPGSNPKETVTVPILLDEALELAANPENPTNGINWSAMPLPILERYRHAYHLPVPPAFHSPQNELFLSTSKLGRMSPSMSRVHKRRRKTSKEGLALAVKKDFNAASVSEQDVVSGFLYNVTHKGQHFRMVFAPERKK